MAVEDPVRCREHRQRLRQHTDDGIRSDGASCEGDAASTKPGASVEIACSNIACHVEHSATIDGTLIQLGGEPSLNALVS